MATAFTSEWEWTSINRSQDVSVQNSEQTTRNNWVVTRKRISNEAYDSQLGESAASLTAYNGGVTETVTPPETEVIVFDTTTNWTKTTTLWIPSGTTNNGAPIYVSDEDPNIPDATRINILYLAYSAISSKFLWYAYESVDGAPGPGINRVGGDEEVTRPSLDGYLFDDLGGTFTGTSTSSISSASVYDFYCSGDNQTYQEQGVDWFTQTQTWIFKDGFQ